MRVLIAAFACRPATSSETGAGWAVAAGAARSGHDVVLITQPRHRSVIEEARRSDRELEANLHPVYIGLPAAVMGAWDRLGGLRGLQIYNLVWQLLLWTTAGKLHRRQPFAVGHHVTLSTDWVPSGLAFVPNLPLVWGPLGGGERVPTSCAPFLGSRGRMTEAARRVTADPLRAIFATRAGRRCSLLVAQNAQEAELLGTVGPPVSIRPNVFLDRDFNSGASEDIERRAPRSSDPSSHRYRAVFAGRLVAWKGVHLAVATLRQAELADWELHLYGRGPERRTLVRDIARFGLGHRVFLHGKRSREEVRLAMVTADAFFYPSMREAAGWVVAEALAVGCPVVCLDIGGPPILLDGTGAAVAPDPGVVASLAQALAKTPGMPRTVVRWDESAVSTLLDSWYTTALDHAAR
jgi:glycosyltransferase involved in cell wall biosynthesis